MNEIDKRKLNLLVHLAKVDGKYDKSEHKLLKQFLREKRLTNSMLTSANTPLSGDYLGEVDSKIELLFWAIKLIQADQVIHDKEIAFGKDLAAKLNFKEDIITHYAYKPVNDYKAFQSEVKQSWMAVAN